MSLMPVSTAERIILIWPSSGMHPKLKNYVFQQESKTFGLVFTGLGYGQIGATLLMRTGIPDSQIIQEDRSIVSLSGSVLQADGMISHVLTLIPLSATLVNNIN